MCRGGLNECSHGDAIDVDFDDVEGIAGFAIQLAPAGRGRLTGERAEHLFAQRCHDARGMPIPTGARGVGFQHRHRVEGLMHAVVCRIGGRPGGKDGEFLLGRLAVVHVELAVRLSQQKAVKPANGLLAQEV